MAQLAAMHRRLTELQVLPSAASRSHAWPRGGGSGLLAAADRAICGCLS
jgi:hypothetical protein